MNQLSTFKGYTVDYRLKEFRKVIHGDNPSIKFVPFDTAKGQELLEEMMAGDDTHA